MTDKYEMIFESFKKRTRKNFPPIVSWWPSGKESITIRLEDNSLYEYNSRFEMAKPIDRHYDAHADKYRNIFVRELRSRADGMGLTQTEIANRLGIRQGAVSDYMCGRVLPSMERAAQIANILNCSVYELTGTYED